MELTPQLLTDEIDFRIAVRGYDRNEVDDFLERVAVAVGQLQDQLSKAVERARTAEAKLADTKATPRSSVEPEAVATAPEAVEKPDVAPTPAPTPEPVVAASVPEVPVADPAAVAAEAEDLNDELRRTLVLAQRTADTAIREAAAEADRIRAEAEAAAQSAREEADAEVKRNRDEARSRLVVEITELESVRESLRDDAGVLERYLGDERARVRETIQVLRRLVDDPKSFQVAPEPALSGARVPEDARALGGAAPVVELAAPEDEVPAGAEASSESAPTAPDAESTPRVAVEPPRPAPAPATRDDVAKGPLPSRPVSDENETPEVPATPEQHEEPTAKPVDEASAAPDAVPNLRLEPSGDAPTTPRAAASPVDSATGTPPKGLFTGAAEDDLGRLFDTGQHGSVDWRAGGGSRGDQGPHTQPVAAARFEEEPDDAFLAELRRAMTDNEPLGPDSGSARS